MFSAPNQTTFFVQMEGPDPLDDVEIANIEWSEVPAGAGGGDLTMGPGGDWRFYPDATAPGGNAQKNVNVAITITPPLPNVPIYVKWRDVDDPDYSTAPLDDDSQGVGDTNNNDNFVTPGGQAEVDLPTSVTTDAAGQAPATLQINWIQPGNNFRIAASARTDELAPVEARGSDSAMRLFYDENGDKLLAGPDEFYLDENGPPPRDAHGIRVTPVLTVWRNLHVEVDTMGAVSGNTVTVEISQTVPLTPTRSRVWFTLPTILPLQDNNRFEGGTLLDGNGNTFDIVSNTTTYVDVENLPSGVVPSPAGFAHLRDDDEKQNGDQVPVPDYSQLDEAMAEAYVTVLVSVDHANMPFELNSSSNPADSNYFANSFDWNTRTDNAIEYWVAYVLGGFQEGYGVDNDPDSETGEVLGRTSGANGGSIVYIETDRDVAVEFGFPITSSQQDTLVHEVGHAVGNSTSEPATLFQQQRWKRFSDTFPSKAAYPSNSIPPCAHYAPTAGASLSRCETLCKLW